MNLWGQEIGFDNKWMAIIELDEQFEECMNDNAKNFALNRYNGQTVTKTQESTDIHGETHTQISVNKWASDNLNSIKDIINNTKYYVEDILNSNNIALSINWDVINEPAHKAQESLNEFYSQAMEQAFSMSAQEFQNIYNNAYHNSLANSKGLGFGIISSSLTAHLIYAAQASAKEVKNEMKAIEAASKAIGNDPITSQAEKMSEILTPFYEKEIEPKMYELLSEYYALVIKYICEGLDVSYTELTNTIDKEKSTEHINDIATDFSPQQAIITALKYNPNNGKVILIAIKYGIVDNEFINYCNNASPYFHKVAKTEIIKLLQSNLAYVKAFYKPIYNEKNKLYVDSLLDFYYQIDEKFWSDWNDIIRETYNDFWLNILSKINEWQTLFASDIIRTMLQTKDQNIIISEAEQLFDSGWINDLLSLSNDFKFNEATDLLQEYQYSDLHSFKNKLHELEILIDKVINQVNAEKQDLKILYAQIKEKKLELKKYDYALFGRKFKQKKNIQKELTDLTILIKKNPQFSKEQFDKQLEVTSLEEPRKTMLYAFPILGFLFILFLLCTTDMLELMSNLYIIFILLIGILVVELLYFYDYKADMKNYKLRMAEYSDENDENR